MCYQDLPEHLCGNFPYFFRCLANVNSAFESIFECSLAATSGVDLRLNHNLDVAQFARDLLRLIER